MTTSSTGTAEAPSRRRASLSRLLASALLLVVLVACNDDPNGDPNGDVAVAPTPTPSPAVAPTPDPTPAATPTATPAPPSEAELRAELDAIAAEVSALRGLEGEADEEPRLVSPEQIRQVVSESLEDPETQARIRRDERLLRLLGLIEPDTQLADLHRDLLGDRVLGAYRARTGELFVRVDGPFGVLARVTYAHEYAHYLQDVHFDLRALRRAARGDADRLLALTALIEGDAMLTQERYMRAALDDDDIGEMLREGAAMRTHGAPPPPILLALLEFPYTYGLDFARALYERGGFDAVNDAFADPPRSTSQVLHPERYFAGVAPADVALPDLATALGSGWSQTHRGTAGEFFLRAWLRSLGAPRGEAAAAAQPWAGDAYALLEHGDGGEALLARIAWSEPAHGEAFARALGDALDGAPAFTPHHGDTTTPGLEVWQGEAGLLGVHARPGETVVAVAPSPAPLDALLGALGAGG